MTFFMDLLLIGCILAQASGSVFHSNIGNNMQSLGSMDAISGMQMSYLQLDGPLNVEMENKRNDASTESGDAISGGSVLLNLVSQPVYITNTRAFRNSAYSSQGQGIVSGNRFSAGTNTDENITFEGVATRNDVKSVNESQAIGGNQVSVKTLLGGSITTDTASSHNTAETARGTTAVSGSQTNLGGVFFTDMSLKDNSSRNTATALNEGNQSSIVSGVQTNVKNQVMSNVTAERHASHNVASGDSGTFVAGVQTNMMNIVDGDMYLNNYAGYNDVQAGNNATQVAGIQFNSFFNSAETSLNNTARDNKISGVGHSDTASVAGVQVNQRDMGSSQFNSTSVSRDNEVTVDQGLAVAGVQNNFREIGEFKDGGVHYLNLDNTASDNKASSSHNAVAGVQNNILNVNAGYLSIKSNATDNNATSTNGTSVGGVQNNLGFVYDSYVTLDNYADSNIAYASGLGQTAVAGTQTSVYNVSKSHVIVSNYARYNEAISLQGKAIGGSQVNAGHVVNGSNLIVFNTVERNSALTNGSYDAVVESATNVGYECCASSVSSVNF